MQDIYITSLGTFLPGEPVDNKHMEMYLGCIGGKSSRYRNLVLRQNKIRTRHYALDRQGNSLYSNAEMAAAAIKDAITQSEVTLADISYLATATTLGDVLLPGLASHVHAALQIKPIEATSFQSVCSSSLMALKSAYLQLKVGEHACAAVSGSEFASRYFRPGFYEQSQVFRETGEIPFNADFLRFTLSDGAGAAILENKPNSHGLSLKIHWVHLRSYADRFDMCMFAGAAKKEGQWCFWGDFPSPMQAIEAGALCLMQDAQLMKRMIPVWVAHYLELIDDDKIVINEIDYVCSHYSSHSLREEVMALLKKAGALIDEEKWVSNLYTKGNTGSASIFILLEELYRQGNLKQGEKILCHVPESGRGLNGFMLLEVV